ncbi:para-nitrobenzyl esterase [Amycolatopsis pretoriensis]|uniref:Para-nitrobenzyl esterase n=1 Tax=Amycolatopsis pretoriensis TaxID=218821 RepID=A0A1H5R1U4_9PSEU|nr:carboxylesterase family protein [Amycolatopsis pretoriensis]SEF32034.1 para-nitrobenzyl esterase [Amycolatopsis pretoriensis]
MTDPVVPTTSGAVRGQVTAAGFALFRGIPYAAAPEGDLRFAEPVPAPPWEDVRDALRPGPTAPQRRHDVPGLDLSPLTGAGWRPGPEYLTVDVWTPRLGAAGLPVLVFVHGGAFLGGTGSAPVYDGTSFNHAGAVLVTVQYRLGVDGFLPLDGGTTNLGLRDQLAALRWVQENIEGFGGNPGNVTFFGAASGAVSVACLLASPLSQGLFHKAIVQSGHPDMVRDFVQARRLARVIADELKSEPTAEAFRKVSTEQLLDAQDAVLRPGGAPDLRDALGYDRGYGLSPFLPVVGDDVLPQHPAKAIKAGAGRDVDLVVGSCSEEMRLYLVPTGALDAVTDDQAVASLAVSHPDPAGVLERYGLGSDAPAGDVLVGALTDLVFRDGVRDLAENHAGRTFRYEFEWGSPLHDGALGACHGLELPFVFDALGPLSGPRGLLGENPPRELADDLNGAWYRFAATGSPGWPEYTGEDTLFHTY